MANLIDWAKVRLLRDEIGMEDFEEVVEIFLEEVEDTISELGTPGRSLEHDLHFLKGSALNLGFEHFSNLCQTGEHDCANGAQEGVDTNEIISAYDQSKQAFLAELQINLAA